MKTIPADAYNKYVENWIICWYDYFSYFEDDNKDLY